MSGMYENVVPRSQRQPHSYHRRKGNGLPDEAPLSGPKSRLVGMNAKRVCCKTTILQQTLFVSCAFLPAR